MLGYDLLSAADIKGLQGSVARGDVFYLASAMAQKSPLLSAVLHRGGKDLERSALVTLLSLCLWLTCGVVGSGNCYAGLRHVLFIVLLTTAGRRCTGKAAIHTMPYQPIPYHTTAAVPCDCVLFSPPCPVE